MRKIESKLKNMFIDFNTGVIIQMKLTDKLALKEKIEKVWNYRESQKRIYETSNLDKKRFRLNLSEADKDIKDETINESVIKSLNFNSSIIITKDGQNDSNLLKPRNRLSLQEKSSLLK